jgi:hypothetical protein
LGKSFLEKMEIGESFFGKKHGKLAHGRNLAPKISMENNNEQPSKNTCAHPDFGNQTGNTPVWGNPPRERIIRASGSPRVTAVMHLAI